jgi:hypothetical protein
VLRTVPSLDLVALNGTLYVADTLDNRIAAIPGAAVRFSDDGTGQTVSEGGALNGERGDAGLRQRPRGGWSPRGRYRR